MKTRIGMASLLSAILLTTVADAQLRRGREVAGALFGRIQDPQGWVTFAPVPWDGGGRWSDGSRLVMISVATQNPMEPSSYVQFPAAAPVGRCAVGAYIRLRNVVETSTEETPNGEHVRVYKLGLKGFRCKSLKGPVSGLGPSSFGAQWGVAIAGLTLARDGLLADGNNGPGPFFVHRPDLWAIWTGYVSTAYIQTYPDRLRAAEMASASMEKETEAAEEIADLKKDLASAVSDLWRLRGAMLDASTSIHELLDISENDREKPHHDRIDQRARDAIRALSIEVVTKEIGS